MLVAFQEVLVLLAANATARARFAVHADAVLDDFPLTPAERTALRGISGDALERYARSLLAKRGDELARVVPLTSRVVPALVGLYQAWLATHPAPATLTVQPPGLAEALRAERAIFDALADDAHAPYAAELWCFEVRRAASRRDGVVRTSRSRFDIAAIAASITRGLVPIDPPATATEVRFERSRVQTRLA